MKNKTTFSFSKFESIQLTNIEKSKIIGGVFLGNRVTDDSNPPGQAS